MESTVFNEDCMIGMARYPDKYFDLAIVDPPYGIDASTYGCGSRSKKYDRSNKNKWDSAPPDALYWDELFRVTKNQIVFGMNYFSLPTTKHFIVWDKRQPYGVTFAQAELAWTSFPGTSKMVCLSSNGQKERFHPTQKPIALYDWLINHYAKPGDKILDTHVGSGSSRISAHKHGKEFIGFEIDKGYWDAQEKRYQQFIAQGTLF